MLIECDRLSAEDRRLWRVGERLDAIHAQLYSFARRVPEAIRVIRSFAEAGPCYAGTSWGKDSTVLAHLVHQVEAEGGPRIPVVSICAEPIVNPFCNAVRDAFLARFPVDYHAITVWCRKDGDGWHATGTLEEGFREAARRWGDRHLSGVRATESGVRTIVMRGQGVAGERTARPIGWWSGGDVFAYLYSRRLPVHPSYAMSMGGLIERERLRVAFLGLKHGRGRGRKQWEERYYSPDLARIAVTDPP